MSSTSKSRSIRRLQLDRQHLLIPAGIERQLVVGQHIGPPLRRIEMGQAQRRHAVHAEQLGGLDPAMAGDDLAVVADQHRIGEAEPLDAVGDLPNLLLGMGAGIAGVGPQPCDTHSLNGDWIHEGSAATNIQIH